MALRTDIVNERAALDTIVKRSALGKHINETMLRPILDAVDAEAARILDDLGFMIVSEIQHRLATAPAGNTYEVWEFNEGGSPAYTFIGYYTASAKGGPPMSGEQTDSGLPTGSLYESFWYKVNSDGILSVTIASPQDTEKDYYFKKEWGKIFTNVQTKRGGPLPVAEYFRILNNKTRPLWFNIVMDRKRKYWNNWMQGRMQKAVKQVTRRWTVHRALRFNIYWESK